MHGRIDPRDEADLFWHFNEAADEQKPTRSLQSSFELEMERRARRKAHRPRVIVQRDEFGGERRHVYGGLVNGQIYVGQGDEHAEPSTHIDGRAIAAAKRDRRIKAVLARVSEYSVFLLDLRYRIPLPDCRAAFGCSDGLAAWRRRRAFPPTHLVHERGAGTVAHLTPTALELYPADTHHRVDQLGRRLLAAPLPWERERGEQFRREAERLVLDAYSEYRARLLGVGSYGGRSGRAA